MSGKLKAIDVLDYDSSNWEWKKVDEFLITHYMDKYCTSEGLQRFQICCIDNYLFGLLDSHTANALGKKDKEGRYCDFVLIDNGISFFEIFPEKNDARILDNYCALTQHPLAREPLTQETIDYINNIDENRFLDFVIEQKEVFQGFCQINGDDHTNTYFNEQMMRNTILRISVLKLFIRYVISSSNIINAHIKTAYEASDNRAKNIYNKHLNRNFTLYKLSELKTIDDINKFKEEVGRL